MHDCDIFSIYFTIQFWVPFWDYEMRDEFRSLNYTKTLNLLSIIDLNREDLKRFVNDDTVMDAELQNNTIYLKILYQYFSTSNANH